MLGFMPNYYTSFIWNAAPMSQKAEVQPGASNDYGSSYVSGGRRGGRVEQAHKTFPGYGQGAMAMPSGMERRTRTR